MSKKLKKGLVRIIIASSLFLISFITNLVLKVNGYSDGIASLIPGKYGFLLSFFIFLAIYIYIGYDVIIKCFRNLKRGNFLDENFLMCLATFGAFGLGFYSAFNNKPIEGFDEACGVLLFYQIGEWFQKYASGKARNDIKSLMKIKPQRANLLDGNNVKVVPPSECKIGDVIIINPGDRTPLDGVIISGSSLFDYKAISGESNPISLEMNDKIISGSVNLNSSVKVRVTKLYEDSTINRILKLIEEASSKKSKSENFISKFAKYYTPVIVALALLIIIVPSIITKKVDVWLYRGLSFLVVSCPCALVVSIPLTFFAGIGGSSKNGILVKGSAYLEKLAKCSTFVFDKTGTITKGEFKVKEVISDYSKEEVLYYAALAEKGSNHPLAKAIEKEVKVDEVNVLTSNVSGKGVVCHYLDKIILCGNHKLMEDNKIKYQRLANEDTLFYVALDGNYLGAIILEDEIKEDAYSFIKYLNNNKFRSVMLSGDNKLNCSNVQNKLNIKEVYGELLPNEKLEKLEELLNSSNSPIAFIGDGINDAPSLIRSDVGIAMGLKGEDVAIEASDIVIMNDNFNSLIKSQKVASKTLNIVKENIIFSLLIKVLVLILVSLGWTSMWLAVFGDVGVAFLAILNAMRAGKVVNK